MAQKIDLTKNETVEWYINGRLWKTCPYSMINQMSDKIKATLKKKGYEGVWKESFMNRVNGHVYINIDKQKCIVIGRKINTGLTDKHGYPIYHDDRVEKDGEQSSVNMHYNRETYYLSFPAHMEWHGQKYSRGWRDIDISDFSEWTKVKDALDIPKKHWKKPLVTTL